MFGLPDCAKNDCPWPGLPGLFRVKVTDADGETWVDLCVICVLSFPEAMREMNKVREEQLLLDETDDEPKLTESRTK